MDGTQPQQATQPAEPLQTTAAVGAWRRLAAADRVNALLGLFLAGLFAVAFSDTFIALARRWNQDPNYGHGYLVPLVSVYLAFQFGMPCRPTHSRGSMMIGAIVILFGMCIQSFCLIVASLVAECAAMLLVLMGMTLVIGGWAWLKRFLAPIGFLVFMVPWPSALYTAIAFPLQLFVSNVSAVALQLLGIPVLHEGNLIHLPTQSMHVAEACSGLRQLTAFLAISTCAALLLDRPAWHRALLLASAIPIAVAVNAFRVTVTGLILHYGDPAWVQGWFHTAEGLMTVGLGLILLMLEISLIDWIMDGDACSPMESKSRSRLSAAG